MADIKAEIAALQQELVDLRFDTFSHDDAWILGNLIREEFLAKKVTGKCLSIHIQTFAGLILFRSKIGDADVGATAETWIAGKANTVRETSQSSFLAGKIHVSKGRELDPLPQERAFQGGGFPIVCKSSPVPLGVIVCSGLTMEEDHGVIVAALKKFLKK